MCLVLRKSQRHIKNSKRYSCKVLVILVICQSNFNFFETFSKKNIQIPNLMKIRSVRDELCHADGRRDRNSMEKVYVDFSNFAKTPKNSKIFSMQEILNQSPNSPFSGHNILCLNWRQLPTELHTNCRWTHLDPDKPHNIPHSLFSRSYFPVYVKGLTKSPHRKSQRRFL